MHCRRRFSSLPSVGLLCLTFLGTAEGEHDSGLQKSNHPDKDTTVTSISVTPEPSTTALFLLATLFAFYSARRAHAAGPMKRSA